MLPEEDDTMTGGMAKVIWRNQEIHCDLNDSTLQFANRIYFAKHAQFI